MEKLIEKVKDLGILVEYTTEIEIAAVGYQPAKGKYIMLVNPAIDILPDVDRNAIIGHELCHILRGDCLVKADNHEAHNMAADVCINRHYKNSSSFVRENGMSLEMLEKMFGEKPPQIYNTDVLYNWIKERLEKKQMQYNWSDIIAGGEMSSQDTYNGMKEIRRIAGEIEKISDELLKEVWEIGGSLASVSTVVNGSKNIDYPAEAPDWYKKWNDYLRKLKSHRGGLKRTFRKEGIVPEIMGTIRINKKRVAIFIDISGSMSTWEEKMLREAKYLVNKFPGVVRLFVFADECKEVKNNSIPYVGCGTQWLPLEKQIQKLPPNYGVVIVSDLYFDEKPQLKSEWLVIEKK